MIARSRCFTNPQQEREFTFYWNQKPSNTVLLEHGGWHFTYLGDDEHAVTKIKNFAHTETDVPRFTENLSVDFLIKNKCGLWGPIKTNEPGFNEEKFEYVKVDGYFPKCIQNNLPRWAHLIIPGAEFSTEDLYKED